MNDIRTTNKLLLIIVIPLILYILNILSFIFIPLVFAIFFALLFTPLVRYLNKRMPSTASLIVVIIIICISLFSVWKVVELSSFQVMEGKDEIYTKLDAKLGSALAPYAPMMGLEAVDGHLSIKQMLNSKAVNQTIFKNIGTGLNVFQKTVTMTLMSVFFMVLLLSGSINFRDVLDKIFFKNSKQSIRTIISIEKSIVKFIAVKTLVSLLTGIGFGVACWAFGISFPLFWGFFAFIINYVQMVGSVISIIVCTLFAFIEINSPGTMLLVFIVFTAVQVAMGSVLEPILMGKSFKINVIFVLMSLMFWGFLWGVPGMILSIPLTVLLKIMLEQFPRTQVIAKLIS